MTLLRWAFALLLVVLAGGCARGAPPTDEATIKFHYSHYGPDRITVPVGVPVHFTLENDDPIAHEWIVGPPELHQIHRTGTEAWHDTRPNEVSVPAYGTRVTTVLFDKPGEYAFVCHLPGHEEYGMKGVVSVVPNPASFALR